MSKPISWITVLAIILSLFTMASGKLCTKAHIHTYTVLRMNPYTQKLVTKNETTKNIIFTCCEGYKEISRRRSQPICEPYYCQLSCEHGICYANNLCKCDEGYKTSELGTCVPEESEQMLNDNQRISLLTDTASTTTQSTTITTPTTTPTTTPSTSTTSTTTTTTTTTKRVPRTTVRFYHRLDYMRPKPPPIDEPRQPKCRDGYAYDSELEQCKPLCNGKIYGCIRGTCIGYNQCRCDNGTVLLHDELYHCQTLEPSKTLDHSASLEKESPFNWAWYLLILVIPILVIFVTFYILMKRWKQVKVNRLEAQESNFSEVRYFNSDNEHSINEKHQNMRQDPIDGPTTSSTATIQRKGNVVIINT